jgi:hypothetical protein
MYLPSRTGDYIGSPYPTSIDNWRYIQLLCGYLDILREDNHVCTNAPYGDRDQQRE